MLKLAPGLTLPDDILTEALAIVANRGSGKTYASKKLVELMTELGLPTCVIDPLGVWWGLRSSADGKKAGLPFIVFGGKHGDVPLKPERMQESALGRIIAQWLLENPVPIILDLSDLRKAAQRRFVAGFLDELYEENENPLHVVVDECDIFCPQKPPKDFPMTLLGTMEDVARRGRAKGLGITLISQRPAVIHKDVLSQISTLMVLRMFGPQDRSAIRDWIGEHGTPEERKIVMDSLQSLAVGDGWFYSPGFLGILQRFRVYKAKTFDSSATPKVGERRIEPKVFAPVDLDILNERIQATVEKAKQSDPKHLQAVIRQKAQSVATLQELVAQQDAEIAELKARPQTVEVQVETIPQEIIGQLGSILSYIQQGAGELEQIITEAEDAPRPAPHREVTPRRESAKTPVIVLDPPPPPAPRRRTEPVNTGPVKLGKREKAILTVLCQFPDGRTHQQLAIQTGYSAKASTISAGLSALRKMGYVEPNEMKATPEGIEAMDGAYTPMPVGPELLAYWMSQLGNREKLLLTRLIEVYPAQSNQTDMADATGYSPDASTISAGMSKLRGLALASGWQASAEFMEAIA